MLVEAVFYPCHFFSCPLFSFKLQSCVRCNLKVLGGKFKEIHWLQANQDNIKIGIPQKKASPAPPNQTRNPCFLMVSCNQFFNWLCAAELPMCTCITWQNFQIHFVGSQKGQTAVKTYA